MAEDEGDDRASHDHEADGDREIDEGHRAGHADEGAAEAGALVGDSPLREEGVDHEADGEGEDLPRGVDHRAAIDEAGVSALGDAIAEEGVGVDAEPGEEEAEDDRGHEGHHDEDGLLTPEG